jgi:hypothetical protein
MAPALSVAMRMVWSLGWNQRAQLGKVAVSKARTAGDWDMVATVMVTLAWVTRS